MYTQHRVYIGGLPDRPFLLIIHTFARDGIKFYERARVQEQNIFIHFPIKSKCPYQTMYSRTLEVLSKQRAERLVLIQTVLASYKISCQPLLLMASLYFVP